MLYGRLPDYHLSELGRRMAERAAAWFGGRDVTHLVSSPLERAQETAAPTAKAFGLDPVIDERVIEAGNQFEGKTFGVGDGALWHPGVWWRLRNPWRPSWGEPYAQIAARMLAAAADARDAARGHEAVVVSHQLPVWIARCAIEGRRFAARPAQAAVRAGQRHVDHLRRRPGAVRRLLRARGRPADAGGRPAVRSMRPRPPAPLLAG